MIDDYKNEEVDFPEVPFGACGYSQTASVKMFGTMAVKTTVITFDMKDGTKKVYDFEEAVNLSKRHKE